MRTGELLNQRYEVIRKAARGGMAVVYRARDRKTSRDVAVKVLAPAADVARFERERRILAGLSHPNIVSYVDGGVSEDGRAWMATEWVEGETLAARLALGALQPSDAVTLALRVAEALRAAHERGVIHRDVKPSNILLPAGELGRAKLGDFGVSRDATAETHTASGVTLGTPGYMSPEQARGSRDVGPRADLFALGCVLYRCLTGRDAFCGDDPLTILVQTVLEEPPPVRVLAPHVSQALERLVDRLMAKSPEGRVASARIVIDTLSSDSAALSAGAADPTSAAPAVTAWEQVIRAYAVARPLLAQLLEAETMVGEPKARVRDERLRRAVESCGARFESLAGGTVVATARGAAMEQAVVAARCALAMHAARRGEIAVAVVTAEGHRSPGDQIASGARALPFERVAALLDAAGPGDLPRIDAFAARLLERRFALVANACGIQLASERDTPLEITFLGRRAPFVGREREMELLERLLESCVQGPAAHAGLLVGEPGIGKSRIASELVRRATAVTEVWRADGQPLAAHAPLRLLSSALRRAAGVDEGDRHQHIVAALETLLTRGGMRADGPLLPFLAEIAGAPWPAGESIALDAARADVSLMGDRMRSAVVELLSAWTLTGPMLIVLEDIHWGDAPSLEILGSALRRLADRPLFVLATARPELDRAAVASWRGVLHELPVRELPRAAAERFVSEVAANAPPSVVRALVQQTAGNPLWLEELTRDHLEGRVGPVPGTFLAMIQARFEPLGAETRRALRAASVFGRTFRSEGVAHLLGGSSAETVRGLLREAEDRELVVPDAPPSSGNTGTGASFAFRHALVAEATYSMLPEEDRQRAHRAAARWLGSRAGRNPLLVAEHHLLGAEELEAVPWLRRAAERALEANDLDAALRDAARAMALGAAGDELASLRLVEAEAQRWRCEWRSVLGSAEAAAGLARPGTAVQYRALGLYAVALGRRGQLDELRQVANGLRPYPGEPSNAGHGAPIDDHASLQRAVARARLVVQLVGLRDTMVAPEVESWLAHDAGRWPAADGWVHEARAARATEAGSIQETFAHLDAAQQAFEAIGDRRNALSQRIQRGMTWTLAGGYRQAVLELTAAAEQALILGAPSLMAPSAMALGIALMHTGDLAGARARIEEGRQALAKYGNLAMENAAGFAIALVHFMHGDLEAAEREARAALAESVPHLLVLHGYATLAELLLAKGRPDEARTLLRRAPFGSGMPPGSSRARLALARAQHATGDPDGAKQTIREARDLLLAAAERSPDLREMMLRAPQHAAVLALAEQLLGSG